MLLYHISIDSRVVQLKLRASAVAIIGAGGLGCPVAQYLAGAGVGKLSFFGIMMVFKVLRTYRCLWRRCRWVVKLAKTGFTHRRSTAYIQSWISGNCTQTVSYIYTSWSGIDLNISPEVKLRHSRGANYRTNHKWKRSSVAASLRCPSRLHRQSGNSISPVRRCCVLAETTRQWGGSALRGTSGHIQFRQHRTMLSVSVPKTTPYCHVVWRDRDSRGRDGGHW